ncbi:hypothetical protein LTR56_024055 [Elasticomyces elasticus]|nr:hypothetical protein LTR56_024055 [Elasticomyces elasticus]
MFDIDNGIEVRIKPYRSPDAYLEVPAKKNSHLYVPDEHKAFQWKKARKVSITYRIDLIKKWVLVPKPAAPQAVSNRCTSFINNEDGVSSRRGFMFAQARMNPELQTEINFEQENIELDKRGKIEVTIQRTSATENKKATRKLKKESKLGTLQLPAETNKKVAGDHGRSHFTEHLLLENLDDVQDVTMYDTKPLSGDGEKFKFTFIYTDRGYMERQFLVQYIVYPCTLDQAIDLDHYVSDPGAPGAPAIRAMAEGLEVALTSTKYVGNGVKKVKVEVKGEEGPTDEKWRMKDEMDCDDEEIAPRGCIKTEDVDEDYEMGPSLANGGSVFGDEEAYGSTPRPQQPRYLVPGSAPPPYRSKSPEQVIAHRPASVQPPQNTVDNPHGLVSVFGVPPQAMLPQPAQPQFAGTVQGARPTAALSSNRTDRAGLLARLQYVRHQQEIADIEAQLGLS